jgi:3-isopropylmalate/(R)-2-methylmalate dehydratase small subunit
MEPFTTFTATAAPLDDSNVDTDQIIPAEFLRKPRSAGFPRFLFFRRRFGPDGQEDPRFVLNRAPFRQARILVADVNFGCGSSRESAVWALVDPVADPTAPGQFRALIAASFGDIFYSNAAKNGLLCVRLPADDCARLRQQLHEQPGATISVDLPAQRVVGPDGRSYPFEIDPFRKECLQRGVDDIDLTLGHVAAIAAWEERSRQEVPWRLL